MIRVVINGREQSLERPLTVAEYVSSLPVNQRWLAVARNGEVVPRHRWPEVVIQDGDVIEVVRMVGGGAPGDGRMVEAQTRPARFIRG
ncbi:MAG: sulfur carrier protein ThiS [Dehalococcoidia bacterium]|jgi:sulfur carrier protein|nr:sulfur carrier protein ThiS [Dehalococcoidia bacterium]MDW8009747.1 sulfur carrier protein ThiS [Chloroflexota bacterium]